VGPKIFVPSTVAPALPKNAPRVQHVGRVGHVVPIEVFNGELIAGWRGEVVISSNSFTHYHVSHPPRFERITTAFFHSRLDEKGYIYI